MSYYAHKGDKIYRFRTWFDLEAFSGKGRLDYKTKSLYVAIQKELPGARVLSLAGARLNNLIYFNGQPIASLQKGNF